MNTFHSTRSNADQLTAKQAIRKGIANDGGLFVSDSLGDVQIDLDAITDKSYQDIARIVLAALLPDFTQTELAECIGGAYGPKWSDSGITPLRPVADDFVLELFHGPTSAFKDIALQMLPRLMAKTIAEPSPTAADQSTSDQSNDARTTPAKERIMILTATSGDTGKAALAGFSDAPDTAITVFYPQGQVSPIQQLQMTTQLGSNVAVCAVKGNFDDAQSAVKDIFADSDMATDLYTDSKTILSSANSINIGRLFPQVVYYFVAYSRLLTDQVINVGDEVEFCVPTGNFGDVLAGYYAMRMGLPVAKLIVASDTNNVLCDFLTTGIYDRNRPFFTTNSPSMDILISSNLERMLYYLSDGDTELISSLMTDLKETGRFEIPETLKNKISQIFSCGWTSEDQVKSAIHDCWEQHHYLIDPHTACGYHVLNDMEADPLTPRILLSTASPYKFPRVVGESLNLKLPDNDFQCMDAVADATGITPPSQLRFLETAPVRFKDVIAIADMKNYVRKASTWANHE
ncbi:MAG: threonine synthase [Bifidobacterium aquikefiri]|uniref:Threonine synthase n=1 Tax=Bifidobacterium aquikefiri TaxID=1653207 RepID=A0A261G2L6_9BIFI|nr:threonine synthase [Bifidobacterium aquikefiri]OZG65413.1 threonine synthase [Bifidobacterium aquikefiri]